MQTKTAKSISKAKHIPPYTLGVDSGSLTAKAVIMDGNRKIVAHKVVQLEFVSETAVRLAMDKALAATGLELSDMAYVVTTGYGRRRLNFADKAVTEISCHAKGANHISPDVRTVIDIGGQDSKVIIIDDRGNVQKFAMNDTCAAGTGQFLQVMARALGVRLSKIGELSLESRTKLKINSMCTVFAESEVISLVAQGHRKEDILASIHESIARRTAGLVGRAGLRQPVIMTGGVAKNVGLVRALEKELGIPISIPKYPQIVGAIGAALFAQDFAAAGEP